MNKLLIHNNNTSFNHNDFFTSNEEFVFDADLDKDVDQYIDEKLTDGTSKEQLEKADIIFIKISLSKNYLEYLGIRLAYHIRLSKSLEKASKVPIIFIAEEDFQFLGLTATEPSILFTKGIYLIRETIEDYQKIIKLCQDNKLKSLEDYSSFIKSININPPSNYQSHHSTANEWALARYFSMLEKDEHNGIYNALEKKIQELHYTQTLHFKYAEAKANRQNIHPKKHSYTPNIHNIENKAIGIIDDEINKGWLGFYDYLITKHAGETTSFTDFRKYDSKENLLKRIQNWLQGIFISKKAIDIFIIDLRLHDDDYSETNFDTLSGVAIIKFIKSHNPGIQIIVSTASNKVWNYQKCLEYGVSHFAIKESPETFSTREETKKTLIHLCTEISNAGSRSYLATIYRKIRLLQTDNIFKKDPNNKEFKELVFTQNGLLDQVLNLLLIAGSIDTVLNQCLLLLFQIIENYCDLSLVGSFNYANKTFASGFVWLKSGKQKEIFINQIDIVYSLIELKSGKFGFQTTDSHITPISFETFAEKQMSSSQYGLDASSLIKMICVLHFREEISKTEIERIMGLRYYRSNVAAHYTGRVDSEKKLTPDDVLFFIDVLGNVFCN